MKKMPPSRGVPPSAPEFLNFAISNVACSRLVMERVPQADVYEALGHHFKKICDMWAKKQNPDGRKFFCARSKFLAKNKKKIIVLTKRNITKVFLLNEPF